MAKPPGLLAIPENKIKEIIEGAESFENLFWAGSTTTLFLTKEKQRNSLDGLKPITNLRQEN